MKRYALFVLAFIAGGCAESNDAGMQLQQENEASVQAASWLEVEAALDALDPKLRSFVILSSPSGDYVQTAGARDRLTIEYRRNAGQGPAASFRHYVLGRTDGGDGLAEIQCSCGPLTVQENEVLNLDDAKRVFRHFYDIGSVPDDFALRDMTATFR